MMAFEPNLSRTVSSVASSDDPCQPSNGNASWIAPSFWRFVKLMPISVMPLIPDHRQGGREQRSLGREQRRGVARRLGDRVRARRAREVVEPQAEDDRAADAVGGSQPARQAIHQRDEVGVERLWRSRSSTERALRPDRAASAADVDPPRIPGCARARGGDARRHGPGSARRPVHRAGPPPPPW